MEEVEVGDPGLEGGEGEEDQLCPRVVEEEEQEAPAEVVVEVVNHQREREGASYCR